MAPKGSFIWYICKIFWKTNISYTVTPMYLNVISGWVVGGGGRFTGWWEPEEESFWPFEPFSKLKTAFCGYWTLIKITISMTCVSKEYEIKTKMVHEQWLQAEEWFWPFEPFSNLKTTFCEYRTLIKIKISMTCASIKCMKLKQKWAMTTAKNGDFLGYNLKIVI